MIVVDSSALIAIALLELDADLFGQAIEADEDPVVCTSTAVECGIVLTRRFGAKGRIRYDRMLQAGRLRLIPFAADHVDLALDAFEQYGKGGGHPAQLNFGDCFSYALAKSTGRPLLYKGSDFSHTDIRSAL